MYGKSPYPMPTIKTDGQGKVCLTTDSKHKLKYEGVTLQECNSAC